MPSPWTVPASNIVTTCARNTNNNNSSYTTTPLYNAMSVDSSSRSGASSNAAPSSAIPLLSEAALQQGVSEVGGGQIVSLPQYHYEPSYVQQHTPHFERNNQSSNEATCPGSFQQYISYSSSSNQLSLLPTMPQQQHQAPHFQPVNVGVAAIQQQHFVANAPGGTAYTTPPSEHGSQLSGSQGVLSHPSQSSFCTATPQQLHDLNGLHSGASNNLRPGSRLGDDNLRPGSRLSTTPSIGNRPVDVDDSNEGGSLDGSLGTDAELVDQPSGPAEWGSANPDAVLARLKTLKENVLTPVGLKAFYKSYSSWAKLKPDQQDKALAWFRKLPENVQR